MKGWTGPRRFHVSYYYLFLVFTPGSLATDTLANTDILKKIVFQRLFSADFDLVLKCHYLVFLFCKVIFYYGNCSKQSLMNFYMVE